MLIEVTVQDVVPAELLSALSEEAVDVVLANIADAARNHWIGLAQADLHTSRNDYINSIQEVEFVPGLAVITLLGQPANLIENGAGRIDLRDWLLGAKVPEVPVGQRGMHRSKEGHLYRAVPFRHQTPGSSGTLATRMGDPYKGVVKNAAALGREIYAKAKELPPSYAEEGRTIYGGRLEAGLAPLLKEHHAVDIYAGMIKVRAGYEKAVQSKYMTFRTISEANPDGWIRPPRTGVQLAKRTSEYVTRLAPQAFEAYVAGIGSKA